MLIERAFGKCMNGSLLIIIEYKNFPLGTGGISALI